MLSSELTKPPWPPPPSQRHVPITLSGLRKSADMNSVSLSMDAPPLSATAEREQRRPATARPMGVTTARPNHMVRHDNHGRPVRSATARTRTEAAAQHRLAVSQLLPPPPPTAPPKAAAPRPPRAPRQNSVSAPAPSPAFAPAAEPAALSTDAPGHAELTELLVEMTQAGPLASEIPPRWRLFETARPPPSSDGGGASSSIVGEEGIVPGQPARLIFPGRDEAAGREVRIEEVLVPHAAAVIPNGALSDRISVEFRFERVDVCCE